jgi:hypothetical protein
MDHRAGLDDMEKRQLLTLPGLELRSLGSQSLYRLRYPGSLTVSELIIMYISIMKRSDGSSEITQFPVTIATNCQVLICCMNVKYIVSHERASSLFFQCFVSILWVMIIFCFPCVKYYINETVYD